MELVWKNPYHKITEDVIIGKTEFRFTGMYNEGCPESADGLTPEEKPDFELDKVFVLIDTPSGAYPLDVTQMLEDISTVKDNNLFEYLHEYIMKKYERD